MARHHHDRRVEAGVDPRPAEILADLEMAMCRCAPIPRRAPLARDIDGMFQLITAAEDAYQQLIVVHVDYAERVLADHIARRSRVGAA
jgi:hypothetical protein